MQRRALILALGFTALAACAPQQHLGPDGLPLPKVYEIKPSDAGEIEYRMLDGVNSLRRAAGLAPVTLDAKLNAAAATHSRDMSVQNRPWHFGSDGSSPLDRARRVGFSGHIVGENISETFETEMDTLGAWMGQDDTRAVILDPRATLMGFAWFQDPSGKLWWTLVFASN